MKQYDLETELRSLKFTHLTESELAAYCDHELDRIGCARVEGHVRQCFICERELELLREESGALIDRADSVEDAAFVERLMEQSGPAPKPFAAGPVEIANGIPFQDRLTGYLRQMAASWQIYFGQGALRGEAEQGEELWRWQSEDGKLQARAMMVNADLTVHFSSSEMELERTRLHFRLGSLNQELMLRRNSDSEVAARIAIPWQYRQGNMADISIEIV